jgi:serine/threonine protein kinase
MAELEKPDARLTADQIAAPPGPGVEIRVRLIGERTSPCIPDHELIRRIGRGSYGEVWLARNIMDEYRAVKVVYRESFDSDRPYEREFNGIRQFEPISRSHPSQVHILHVGKGDRYFYYVMELADDANTDGDGPDAKPHASSSSIHVGSYAPRTLKERSHPARKGACQ